MRIPERVTWAVGRLNLRPTDDVLEIGCGPGIAVALIVPRLEQGTITAIDRSATAIARARERNRAAIDHGTAAFRTVSFEAVSSAADVSSLEDGRHIEPGFDVAFAINVNLFWVRPAHADVDRLVRLLRPKGRLHLIWEPPNPGRAQQIADRVGLLLSERGLTPGVAFAHTASGTALVDVHATMGPT
ncbi:MAG TPA: methyltransferase [Micromonosporaceae bacterium]|nr:methyltransferase [Micromonosporaceae bacterium]